jgi:hypothetical protein
MQVLMVKTFSYAFLKHMYDNDLFTVTFAMAACEDRLAIGHAMLCLQFPLVSLLVNN